VNGDRPGWGAVGAQLVSDVEPFELMKLRCLNGTHSTLAYLGYLAGYETISETVADPAFAKFINALWINEILPTLPQPEGEDLPAYAQSLLARYQNPAIRHKTWQIAMDGSQKLPQRLLGTIADNLAAGRDIAGLALAVAGWMRYVGGVDEKGAPIDVKDPLAAQLRATYDSVSTPEDKVAALLAMGDVFPADLATNPTFRAAVTLSFMQLNANGARATVQGMI
jgi:fructuronate reductase